MRGLPPRWGPGCAGSRHGGLFPSRWHAEGVSGTAERVPMPPRPHAARQRGSFPGASPHGMQPLPVPQRGAGGPGPGAGSEQGVCVQAAGSRAGRRAGREPGRPQPRSWAGSAASHIPGAAGRAGAWVGAGQVHDPRHLPPGCPQPCPNLPLPPPDRATPPEPCCQPPTAPSAGVLSPPGAAGTPPPAQPAQRAVPS